MSPVGDENKVVASVVNTSEVPAARYDDALTKDTTTEAPAARTPAARCAPRSRCSLRCLRRHQNASRSDWLTRASLS
ncbi:hypothetical protein BN903_3 [Halorubrum sp. AJ67]|nr:hypothetical protein BN903_3 [Halorubrum sp. AJ67]